MVLQLFFPSGGNKQTISDNTFNRRNISPRFNFSNDASVSASGFFLFDFESENSATGKYIPFNVIRIVNFSNADIDIFPNQDQTQGIPIAAGTTQVFTQDQIGFIRSLLFENISSATTINANEIRLQVLKDRTSPDSTLKRLTKIFFGENQEVF